MKRVTCTDFQTNTSQRITEVEAGETLILLRKGKPVALIPPVSKNKIPVWKKPGIHHHSQGGNLSAAILDERN